MSDNLTLAISIIFMIAFWAAVIWLFFSEGGQSLFRIFAFIVVPVGLAVALYLHWEPYVAMICLPAGFVAGVFFAEWHYGVRDLIDRQSAQRPQHQQQESREQFQQSQRRTLDYERVELTYQNDPGATPRA